MIDFLQKGCIINLFRKLKDALAQKQPENVSFLFHHDNAPAQRATVIVATLEECQFELLPNLPYSTDLAPTDIFLFPEMKKHLLDRHFQTDEAFINEVVQWCESQVVSFFSESMRKLEHRLDKCVRLQGDHNKKS